MKHMYWLVLVAALLFAGCDKYDDSELRTDVQNLENRVNALEKWQSQVNSNIASLQSIVNALDGVDYITDVSDLKDSSGKVIGYAIHFANGGQKNIYHGKDGADGADGAPGANGADGKDAEAPVVGVKIDSDGIYYWTLDGQWLLDANGKKVQASGTNGKDGADGITPKVKLEGGFWYVSYDEGSTWTQLGSATSGSTVTSSACIFKSVHVGENLITFTLADGSSFALPYGDQLSISFTGAESVMLTPNAVVEIPYTVTSTTTSVDVEVVSSGDIFAEVVPADDSNLKGVIKVTAGATLNNQSKVVVLVTNGGKIIMKSIVLEKETLKVIDDTQRAISANGGAFTLEFLTNLDFDVVISDDAQSWITQSATRAIVKHTLNFQASANGGDKREGTITIQSRTTSQKLVYTIVQDGANSVTLAAGNTVMPTAGTLTAQYASGDTAHGVDKMVDGDASTYYEIAGKNKFTVVWEGTEPVFFNRVYLDFGAESTKQPQGMTFYLSEDGVSWVPLFGIGSSYLTTIDHEFDAPFAAKAVKIEISNDSGHESIAIAEFKLMEAPEVNFTTFDQVVANASGFTADSTTPMGNHYADKHVTTDADKQWLATASNEPALLPSASGYTYRSYTVELYPFDNPVPADVNQHGIGDCSALAVFASMAYQYPDFIKSIITDHGDGTYTVDMFDPQGEPVEVTIQSTFLGDENGIGAVSGKEGQPTWATVLEKAIMKWNYIYQVNPDINGIGSEHVAPLFTGNGESFAYYPGRLDPTQQAAVADLSLKERMIVIGGFTTGGLAVGSYQTVTLHAYTFMYSTVAEALFAMRNPWGFSPGSDGSEDGILDIVDDGVVPPTIDMRIIYPGKAKEFAKTTLSPYEPPTW